MAAKLKGVSLNEGTSVALCELGKCQEEACRVTQEKSVVFPLKDLKEFGSCLSQICVLVQRMACFGPGAYFGQVSKLTWQLGLLLQSVPVELSPNHKFLC